MTAIKRAAPAWVLCAVMNTPRDPDPLSAFPAGVAYGALLFAIGFATGALRTVFLTPSLGRADAVLVELPFVMVAGWVLGAWLMASMEVAARFADRVVVTIVALGVGMAMEVLLGRLMEPRTMGEVVVFMVSPDNRIGLLAQALVCAFPLVQLVPLLRTGISRP